LTSDSLTNLGLNLDLDALLRCAFLVVIAFASMLLPDRWVLEIDGTAIGIPIAVFAYKSHEKASRLSARYGSRWGREYQRLANENWFTGVT